MKKKIARITKATRKTKAVKKLHPRTNLIETLYTYARPVNATFARKRAERMGISYSEFVDGLIQAHRTNKSPKLVLRAIQRAA